ncbi:MAG: hypothetical protein R3D27_07410 [Hyphomicrobiaceae bacterium]
MSSIVRTIAYPPEFDLSTMRETLRYMQGEMKRVPALADAAQALETAIIEMERAETRSRRALRPQGFNLSRFSRIRH